MRLAMRAVALVGLLLGCGPARAVSLASLDLSAPFATRSPWRFTAMRGPDVADPIGEEDRVPGAVTLCLSHDGGRSCDPATDGLLVANGKPDLFSEPHSLGLARIVHPRADRPLLLLQVGSVRSGDGDERMATVLLGYDRRADRFRTVYLRRTGHNNNQEVRYVETGPLRGAVIAAGPTGNAPFGFWITVDRLAAGGAYASVLRYRSATRYGDGNPLAVIDSEMPAVERRLGLWRPGRPLPVPPGDCLRPHLVRAELWCR